ncbi:hypothetical protein GYB22_05870 [bacterium]|nr:hypothetical protein [bacterium]
MNNTLKYIIIIIALVLVGAGIYGYMMYNKPHVDVAAESTLKHFSADELLNEFTSKTDSATIKFADQIIEVEGDIYSIELENASEPQITLSTNDPSAFIRCGFKVEALENVKNLKVGDHIQLKGQCKGMNDSGGLSLLDETDIIVSKCIIIE